jgi:nucleotide-binding universal stress UspA family protein
MLPRGAEDVAEKFDRQRDDRSVGWLLTMAFRLHIRSNDGRQAMATAAFRRVLWPTDFSEPARRALDHAIAFALHEQARLIALHVEPRPVVFGGEAYATEVPLDSETLASLARSLEQAAAPAREAGIAVETRLVEGDPLHGILDEIDALAPDLVVVGTHGRRGLERFVLGSVAEAILRRSLVPVLTVPPESRAPRLPSGVLKRIMCPVDLTPAARHTLDYALDLALHFQARLEAVHVVEGPAGGERRAYPHFDVPEFRGHRASDAQARLRAAVPAEARDAVAVGEIVTSGRAPEEILRLARERDADLIVMGAHGAAPLDVLFFGSTAREVIRGASCPVITLRSAAALPSSKAKPLSMSA